MAIKLPKKTARSAKPAEVTVREALAEMGWKSDAELIREALGPTTVREALLSLHRDVQHYVRWIAPADEQDSATELITILRAPDPDPEEAEGWIERHRDSLTPSLLASIVKTAMDRQAQESLEPLLAGKKKQREMWEPLLQRWEELERKGIKGEKRKDMICQEFPIGRLSIHSTLTKARTARKKAQQGD
jgi:hypothetical protein